jgi:hypothetical protein
MTPNGSHFRADASIYSDSHDGSERVAKSCSVQQDLKPFVATAGVGPSGSLSGRLRP